MNREEILAMKPGRELDALVAEHVFGYKRVTMSLDYYGKNGGNEVLQPQEISEFYNYPPVGRIPLWYHCKEWSTDISEAWEVRQWLLDNRGGVRLEVFCDENPEYCEVYQGKNEELIQVWAKTSPEAICKAALLAVMEGQA